MLQSNATALAAELRTNVAILARRRASGTMHPLTLAAAAKGQTAVRVNVPRGEKIVSEGESATTAYLVINGVARLCTDAGTGCRVVTDFLLPDDPIGAVERTHYFWSAEAITEVELLQFPKNETATRGNGFRFENALARRGWELAADTWRFHQRIASQNPKQRLLSFLVRFSSRTNTPAGIPMQLPMSYADIASHLVLPPEVVAKTFDELQRYRFVKFSDPQTCTILESRHIAGYTRGAAPVRG